MIKGEVGRPFVGDRSGIGGVVRWFNWCHRVGGVLAVLGFTAQLMAATATMSPVTGSGAPLQQTSVTVAGAEQKCWQCDEKSAGLTWRPDAVITVPANGTVYVKLVYLDAGYGRISVQIPLAKGTAKPDRYLGLAREDSGTLVTARMRFTALMPGMPVSLRVALERPKGETLSIASVIVQDAPFTDDAHFTYALSDPWMSGYAGPTVKPADNTTLAHKVMVGYQGWFRTPNDLDGGGWNHWGDIPHGAFSVDMWPEVSAYPAIALEKAADVRTKSGKQGWLFSSTWPEVTDQHFRWMREHDIDGAFVQRFVSDRFNSISGGSEWVLAGVRAAANREGRIWAVEYDVSGYADDKLLGTLKKDWAWFVDTFKVRGDPAYAHEGGKPVVFIWGLPFPNRHFTPATADAVVDFFANDPMYGGNYVIGGIPGNWRKMEPAWQQHIAKYASALPWMSESFAEDHTELGKLGVAAYAHVKPGFSWANLKHLPTGDPSAFRPRDAGRTYWNLLAKAAKAGADRLFVGMFDEYDEGTAIAPMSDDPPPTPSRPGVGARFCNGPTMQEYVISALLPAAELVCDGKPPARNVNAQDFSSELGGLILCPAADDYTFAVEAPAGDDVALWINGVRVLEAKNLAATAVAKAAVHVAAKGPVVFRLACHHASAPGTVRLLWSTPGMARQAVPASATVDAWGRFLGNEGMMPDHWLELTRCGKEMITGKRPVDAPMPQ